MEKLTELKIKNIKPTEREYYIREGNGFVLRIQKPCSRTFCFVYDFAGKRCRMVLGSYPSTSLAEAREKHMQALLVLKKGVDPKTLNAPVDSIDTTPEVFKIKDLISSYIDHSRKNKAEKTAHEEKRILEKHILPAFGSLPVADLRRRDAIQLIDDLSETVPGTARAIMKISRAMYTWAIDREHVEINPFAGISRTVPAVRKTERNRVLSDDEIRQVWAILSDPKAFAQSEFTRRALMLILVTGQRPGECSGLLYSEIQQGEGKPLCKSCGVCGWWTIPEERSKNGLANDVYLSPLAKKITGKPFDPKYAGAVFMGVNENMAPVDRAALSHYVRKHKQLKTLDFTPHDLRRTAATGLSKLGCMDEVIDAILNHQKAGVIKIYNRNRYLDAKREWLMKWSDHLLDLTQ